MVRKRERQKGEPAKVMSTHDTIFTDIVDFPLRFKKNECCSHNIHFKKYLHTRTQKMISKAQTNVLGQSVAIKPSTICEIPEKNILTS